MTAMTANTGRRVTTLAHRIALNMPSSVRTAEPLSSDIMRCVGILAAAHEDDTIAWEDAAFIGLVLARHRGLVESDAPNRSLEMDAFDLLGAAVSR